LVFDFRFVMSSIFRKPTAARVPGKINDQKSQINK